MLKKSFLRVKQRADQGLGRAEKTEVLSEDLQNAEKKVEALKQVLQNLVKKLTASLQAHNIQDAEKRAKKMPIVHLASSLSDNSSQLGEGMLSDVMQQCSMGLHSIGYAQQFYELTVENSFLSYFQEILDVDVPAIKKSKQQLNKLTLDMDATRSRQQSAAQNSSHSSQTKTESLNNELEDAEHKVASCKDQYATEMFTFLSKESEICNKIIEWMTAQMSLYKTSVTHLEDMLADLKCMTEQHATKPVYGNPLEEHLQSTGREIALVIEACIGILYHDGLEEEGLFRIAAGASKLKKLKAAFNVGALVDMEEYYTDYHVVAGALKQYIRELPEPLLTYDLYEEFIQCMNAKDREAKLTQMWTTIYKLPKPNLANVKYLIKFLAKLAEKSDINKMTPSNISIVFGPNLLSPRNKDPGSDVVLSGIQNHVVETLILHHDYFFPGEIQFADVDSIGGSSNSSSPPTIAPSMHSFGQSTSGAGDCRDGNANDKKPHYEHSASQSSLSNSQISLSSNESGGTNLTHSPSLNRKFKKHAPPPPPTNPPQLHKEASKPDGPDYKHSEHSVIKKPSIPPPGPPVKPLARPTNAPPPKPTVPPHPNVLNSPKTPSNPFEDNSDVKFEPVNASSFGIPSRSLSDSATPTANTKAKTHARNVSAADIKVDQSPSPEVKGHNRTKSHDFKLRQPPPIPQRTHSIPAKHSPEHKRLAAAASVPAPPNKIEPSVASPDKLVDVGPTNQTGNAYLEVSSDVIIESTENTVETADKIEYRDRMNSQSDATSL